MGRTAPHKFVSRVPRPKDFDGFWQDVTDQVDRIPLDPEVIPDPLRTTEDVDVYRVYFNSLDNVRIFGWYCLPKERRGHLPALLTLPGYNAEPGISRDLARKGYAALDVAPRGKVGSDRQFNPGYPGLLTHNVVDRNTYAYRGFYVDAWRGVDFLLSRNEVDPRRIGVQGGSQGGGLTITTAAMRPQVKAAAAKVPFLCGIMDAVKLTDTYPYYEIAEYLRLYPERRKSVEDTLGYFDGNNFAERVRCPIIVSIGLQDQVCPPETGHVVFSLIGSPDKKLYPYDGYGHGGGGAAHGAVIDEFFRSHLSPRA